MPTGALTEYLDVAQVALYVFWFFFFGLIVYLVKEGKREGYPLEREQNDDPHYGIVGNLPSIPAPKTYRLSHGRGTVQVPDPSRDDDRPINAVQIEDQPGAPFDPTGNPLLSGFGPASYAERADYPDLTMEGHPRIVPLRAAAAFSVDPRDANPIGMPVIGADRATAGTVSDVWVDQAEMMIRYYEVELGGERRVLLPVAFANVTGGAVHVRALQAAQFADVPAPAGAEQITRLEEDKICGYYGGGTLYATPLRREPLF